jgi:two-component system OmpR family sensor kinase
VNAAVEVTLTTVDGRAVVAVADHGSGIAPDEVSRLFERFYRGDASRSRARGGTGLGLSIVAAVVAASAGTVGCESAPGRGSVFTVTLPLSTRISPAPSTPLADRTLAVQPVHS